MKPRDPNTLPLSGDALRLLLKRIQQLEARVARLERKETT